MYDRFGSCVFVDEQAKSEKKLMPKWKKCVCWDKEKRKKAGKWWGCVLEHLSKTRCPEYGKSL